MSNFVPAPTRNICRDMQLFKYGWHKQVFCERKSGMWLMKNICKKPKLMWNLSISVFGVTTLAHSAKMIMILHYTYVHHSGNQLFAISKVRKKARVSARNTFSLHQYTIAPSLFLNRWNFYISFYVERSQFNKQPELV